MAYDDTPEPFLRLETGERSEAGVAITELPEEERQALVSWLHRLEGQVRGVAGMIERGELGEDVLVQLAAVRSSVSQLTSQLLEAYVEAAFPSPSSDPDEDAETDDANGDAADQLKRSLRVVLRHS